jgi:uncharacterized membrane protein YcfT
MVWSNLRVCALLELTVILFQVFGVAALCLNRLLPATRWAFRGRVGLIFALVGLAVAGALCGRLASEFALYAGGTMTVLLIGMTTGHAGGHADHDGDHRGRISPEPNLAG